MTTIKSFTDIPQSKVLSKILPIESADYHYIAQGEKSYFYPYFLSMDTVKDYDEEIKYIPCWSLAALLGVLPEGYSFVLTKSFNGKDYYCKLDGKPIETMADNPVDACYDIMLKLHELQML